MPNDDLITKKELLAKYGISYGALYRWKRMGLIPEEWFIKRAASTGQETYFDRAAITERIDAIMALKDTLSLDEIAARFTSGGSATHEKKAPAVRMVWRSGEKSIAMGEITGMFLVDPDGRTVEITGQIKDIAGEAFKNE